MRTASGQIMGTHNEFLCDRYRFDKFVIPYGWLPLSLWRGMNASVD